MKPTKTVANSMFGEVQVQNSCKGRPCRSLSGMNSAPPGSTAMTFSPYVPSLTSMSSLSVVMRTPCERARPGGWPELIGLAWLARPRELAEGAVATLRPRVATLVVPSIGWFRVGYTACFHRCHLRDQSGPIARKSGTGMPVVGMVGGGQLARMTAAAAVGLGVTFRVLSESESESAALVTRDVTIGSHLSLPDMAAFAGRM